MRKFTLGLFIIILMMSLMGCASQTRRQNTGIGVLIGATMGGLTGNPVFMFPIGVMTGMVGYMLESSDDKPKYKKNGGDHLKPPTKKYTKQEATNPHTYQHKAPPRHRVPPEYPRDSSRIFIPSS